MKPLFLSQDYESRLVAHLDILPYQEGTPLSPIHEEGSSTEIAIESSVNYSLDRELFVVISPNNGMGTSNQHERTPQRIGQLEEVSQDELSAIPQKVRLASKEIKEEQEIPTELNVTDY